MPVIGGPAAPKEADLIYKLGDKEVLLYRYEGELPKGIHADISRLTVTSNAFYVSALSGDECYLKKINVADGVITTIDDLGRVDTSLLTLDGTNVYYSLYDTDRKDGIHPYACYDGTSATEAGGKTTLDHASAVYGGKEVYSSAAFLNHVGVMAHTLTKEGFTDAKNVLAPDVIKKFEDAKDGTDEGKWNLFHADRDGFYTYSSAMFGNKKNSAEWVKRVRMYTPDGTEQRIFEVNKDIPDTASKLMSRSSQVVVTKDYVVFYFPGYIRVFRKSDGTYVGDIKPVRADGKNIDPVCVATDDVNHIYFIDRYQEKLHRLDL